METVVKPLYLLADSQLLFLKDEAGQYYLNSLTTYIDTASARASYIGASNDDNEDFYQIFLEGMHNLGVKKCRMIRKSFMESDKKFLEESDVIVLAGGDVDKGLETFSETGMGKTISNRISEGAILIGVSAGAIQLGWEQLNWEQKKISECLKAAPFQVDVHSEDQDWEKLKYLLSGSSSMNRGFGIPTGGGLIYHADNSVEAIRKPLSEFIYRDNKLHHAMLFSGPSQEPISN